MIDIAEAILEHQEVIASLRPLASGIREVAERMTDRLDEGGKILWMGHGGSAADSQHLASTLEARFRRERLGLASIALTVDSSSMAAFSNEYGFERVFERQIEAFCQPNDVVVGLSISGQSPSILSAVRRARRLGALTVGLAGGGGGDLVAACDLCLVVPSDATMRIHEAHVLIGHLLCEWIDSSVIQRKANDVTYA
ncbi:SIS domain-containing protein [Singulisphaera sp. PoT]|uniref:SIS domain-containing protein n=1 Tax=Singulisphaera sp. PoT TaxID=3411797 RepID=UPI003BF5D75E